ncbi:MAG: serine hydrolase [Bacilli bacterium]
MKNRKTIIFILICILSIGLVGCKDKQDSDDYLTISNEIPEDGYVSLYIGDTYNVTLDTNLSTGITWSVSDPNIVTVNTGEISAISAGLAEVSVTNGTLTDTIAIYVMSKGIEYRTLTIDGVENSVGLGSNLYYVLINLYDNNYYEIRNNELFLGWFLDSDYTQECDIRNTNVEDDMNIYSQYKDLTIEADYQIDVSNIIGYEGAFDSNAMVQTFSPAFATSVGDLDYSNYTFVNVNYNVAAQSYYVESILSDEDSKANTIIPASGAILCINKDYSNYSEVMSELAVNKTIRLNHYSVNTATTYYINPVEETVPDSQLNISIISKYGYAYDVFNKCTLFTKNADTKAYPASTTKIITAIAALKVASLDDTITVGDELALTYEGPTPSVAGIEVGEIWTLRDLLYAMLLPSGNDAAYEVAALAINSEFPGNTYTAREKLVKFRDNMNEVATLVGATGSHFMVPDGNSYYTETGAWDERLSEHYTTASDMAKIATYGFAFGALAEVVQTPSKSLITEDGSPYTFYNTNQMIRTSKDYYYEGAVGMKTGTTTPAGACLVSAVEKNGRFIIVTSLYNSSSLGRYVSTATIYNAIFGIEK